MLKNRRSVRFQLALWYLAVLTAGMAAFGAASWIFLREVLLENHYRSLDQRLDAVAAFMQNEARGNALSDLREEAREFATGLPPGQGFRVHLQSGELLFEKKYTDAETLERTRHAVIRGHPLDMTLVISMADFHRVLDTLARVMFTALPLVLLFAMAGGWWLARRALQPVGAMTHEARRISARDLSARVTVPSTGDELQELAESWNELLGRIESGVRAVKRFTADAAHDLRTPVTVIRTSSELALRQPRSPESYRQTIAAIEQESSQMTELLDQLLLLARGDAGDWKFRFENVFADQILRGLRTSAAALAENLQVRLAWMIPADSIMIRADEMAIRRLIMILVDNATKHTPAGGDVSIRLSSDAGASCCEIVVEDTGTGIPPGDLPHIFDRFYRADAARTPGQGVGLGLAIARAIVDAHQGEIQVQPRPGGGSIFSVRLPLSTLAAEIELNPTHARHSYPDPV